MGEGGADGDGEAPGAAVVAVEAEVGPATGDVNAQSVREREEIVVWRTMREKNIG